MTLNDNRLLWLSIVFLTAVVTHAETVQYWFVATDSLSLIETSRVQTITDVAELFAQPLMAGTDFVELALFYRPISTLSYALDYIVWQRSPAGYHLTNILLHSIASVIVAATIIEITTRPVVGYLSALLFAVHPLTVGVVPAISRRQDILMTIFVLGALLLFIRSRRQSCPRLLGGALIVYILALGAKETAVVLPGIVFVWLVIHRNTNKRWPTLARSASEIAPFVIVTITYLLVRLVVLGGLGGYQDSAAPDPGLTVLFVPLKYLLWLFQPTNAVGSILTALPWPVLLVLLLSGVVGSLEFIRQGRLRSLGTLSGFALVVSGIAFAALRGLHPFITRISILLSIETDALDVITRYVTNSLFVVGCIACLLVAILTRERSFDAAIHRQLQFFASWVVMVPGLLLVTGAGIGGPLQIGDQLQTGYLCIIPAMASLSLLVLTTTKTLVDKSRSGGVYLDANVAIIVFTVLLLLPLVAVSPVVISYDEWRNAGDLNKRTLTELDDELDGVSSGGSVCVLSPPTIESDDPPLATSVKQLNTYSYESWFELQNPPTNKEIRFCR